MRNLKVLSLLLIVAALVARANAQSHIKTVFIVLMENRNWTGGKKDQNIKGNPHAPYMNNTLLPMASHAEQYFNPPGIHPSLPNYLWLEAGTNFGILNDSLPKQVHVRTSLHLVDLLENAGITWKAYAEPDFRNPDFTDCPLDFGEVDVNHVSFVYFSDISDDFSSSAARCIAHVKPYSHLATDLVSGTACTPALVTSGSPCYAQYNFITPNLCDDMHDRCKPLRNWIKQGDTWLSSNVPMIVKSAAYQSGGALFITWDEADTGDGPIGMIVLSRFAKGGGYRNSIHYTHGSTLRTLQEIFGVSPFLGDAANESDLSDLFAQFP